MNVKLEIHSVLSCVKWREIAPYFFLSARRAWRRIVSLCNWRRNAAERKKGKQDTSVDAWQGTSIRSKCIVKRMLPLEPVWGLKYFFLQQSIDFYPHMTPIYGNYRFGRYFFEPQNIEQGISNVEVPFSYATNSVVLIALLDRKAWFVYIVYQ